MDLTEPYQLLQDMFNVAINSVSASSCIPSVLPPVPAGTKACVVGAGKAAAAMASVVEQCWPNKVYGTVLTRYGHAVQCDAIEVVEASHPVPDDKGLAAAQKVRQLVRHLGDQHTVVCLISGGASALLTLPYPGIHLEDKRQITKQLLACGAHIAEMNCVRKHLSAIKGGKLGADIFPAKVLTICISDVVGDDPSIVGSGPTVPDPTTCKDAIDVLNKYDIHVPSYIHKKLMSNELETPKTGCFQLSRSKTVIAARPMDAFQACIDYANDLGIKVHLLGDNLEGDTNTMAREHAGLVRNLIDQNSDHSPFLLLSGGESTVKIFGEGKGGPNTQFALALALELQGLEGVYALVCDTDGIDGSEDNAGAWISPDILTRARQFNLDPIGYLHNNDSYSFFHKLDNLMMTGPTLTNVNDFRAILFTGAMSRLP